MKIILALLLCVVCLSTGNSYGEGVPGWTKEEEERHYRESDERDARNGTVKGCSCAYCRMTRLMGRPAHDVNPHVDNKPYFGPDFGQSSGVKVVRVKPAKQAKAAPPKPKKFTITITISFD